MKMGCDIHIMVEKKIDGKWVAQSGVDESSVNYYRKMLEDRKITLMGITDI